MSAGKAGPRLWPVNLGRLTRPQIAQGTRGWEGKWNRDPAFPPTGLQEVSRRFRCRGCYSTVCDLPLDCPGEGRSLEGQRTRGTGETGAVRGGAETVTRPRLQFRT